MSRRSSNSRSRRWRELRRRLRSVTQRCTRALTWPFRRLFAGLSLIDAFHYHGVSTERSGGRRSSRRTQWKRWISWPIQLLTLPGILYRRVRRRGKQRELLFLLPAAALGLLLAFVGYQNVLRRGTIENRYLAGARAAVDNADFELAQRYLLRTLDPDRMTEAQTVSWAALLGQTGEQKKATELLQALAPEGETGYRPAHQLLADNLCRQYLSDGTPPDIAALKWHLEQADPDDLGVQVNWSTYHRAAGEPREAVEKLLSAAQVQPIFYLRVAQVCRQELDADAASPGLLSDADREYLSTSWQHSLGSAILYFNELVEADPHDELARLRLAESQGQLKRFEEARQTLNGGLLLSTSQVLTRARSQLEVLACQDHWERVRTRSPISPADLTAVIILAERAIQLDPTNVAAHLNLVEWQRELEQLPPGQTQAYREALNKRITAEDVDPLDYLLSARWYWHQGDQPRALEELHRAWFLDPDFGRIAHRLAEASTVGEEAYPDWLRELAESCILENPQQPEYRRVRGTIYLRLGRPDDAIAELEPLIGGDQPQALIHQLLADAYKEQKNEAKAQDHHEKAQSLLQAQQ